MTVIFIKVQKNRETQKAEPSGEKVRGEREITRGRRPEPKNPARKKKRQKKKITGSPRSVPNLHLCRALFFIELCFWSRGEAGRVMKWERLMFKSLR